MVKEGGIGSILSLGKKTWKRRYFVMESSTLSYYESEAAFSAGTGGLKGTAIDVRQHYIVEGGGEGADISLIPAGGDSSRSWRFRTESKGDLAVWVAALLAHGARRKGGGVVLG